MDEKGFLIGILKRLKWVFFRAVFKSGKVKNIIQDGNREWITVLAMIYIDKITFLLGLIY